MTILPKNAAEEFPLIVETFCLPGDAEAFARLNTQWLEEFFVVEEEDARMLRDPQSIILDKGGQIFFARRGSETLGTVAMIKLDETCFELAKMGVERAIRGQGIGRKLVAAAVAWAQEQRGAQKILICTHHSLESAIKLYKDFGFVPSSDPRHHVYDRADVFLEKIL